MKVFSWQKSGVDRPVPKLGARRYFYLLWNNFWMMVGINLLFVLFCIPVVTIPAALCARNRVMIKLVRDGTVLSWLEFRDEFKSQVFRRIPLGFIFGGLLVLSYYLLSWGYSYPTVLLYIILFCIGLAIAILTLGIGTYAFIMCAMFDLSNRAVMKNAWAMFFRPKGHGMIASVVAMLLIAFAALLFPLSMIPFLVVFFSLYSFSMCFIMNGPIQKTIIDPFERAKAAEKAENGGQTE